LSRGRDVGGRRWTTSTVFFPARVTVRRTWAIWTASAKPTQADAVTPLRVRVTRRRWPVLVIRWGCKSAQGRFLCTAWIDTRCLQGGPRAWEAAPRRRVGLTVQTHLDGRPPRNPHRSATTAPVVRIVGCPLQVPELPSNDASTAALTRLIAIQGVTLGASMPPSRSRPPEDGSPDAPHPGGHRHHPGGRPRSASVMGQRAKPDRGLTPRELTPW
jgi:hypothetical protein